MSTDQPRSEAAATVPPRVRRPPAPTCATPTVTRLAPRATDTGDAGDVAMSAVQGTLALDLGRPAPPTTVRGLHAVEDLVDLESPASPGGGRVLAGPAALEVRGWAGRFAQAVVEVLGGDRPVAQLLRCTTPRVYQELDRRAKILARTSPAPLRRRTLRPQVRSVHVFQPTTDTAEVCVHVGHGQRSRALAARLERRDGRWTCTALQVG
ncbi:MAG: Rv3235 family protein [Nocardioidaceae bacterium]